MAVKDPLDTGGTFKVGGGGRSSNPGTRGLPPKKPKKPAVPKYTTPKLTQQVRPTTPSEDAMGMFRSTLSQIRSLQTPVDQAAIAAPYDASKVAVGQLGQGLANAEIASGQKAQDQYNQGRNDAQQHAAAFGISAGAGANPTQLTDNGTTLLAQQTQAQAAAANQAATAWQGLLERTKAAAISKAMTDRQNQDLQVQEQLAGNIPGWQQNAEQLDFQKDTAQKNYLLALGTAKDKRTQALRDYLLDKTNATTDALYKQGLLDIGNRNATTGERRASLMDKAEQDRVAHWGQVETRLNNAAKTKGLTGVSSILKVLQGPKAAGGKQQQGYKVTVAAFDSQGMIPGTQTSYIAASPHATPGQGYQQVGIGTPNMVTTGGGSQKFSWSRYNAAFKLAKSLNPNLSDAIIRQALGSTPSTKKPATKPGKKTK